MKVSLIELFEETVGKYPEKTAVIDKDRTVSFVDLRGLALQTATTIVGLGIPQNRPVGVFLDKSIESVYADLGILYAGDFYMNLDIKTPAERIKNIIQLVEPAAIISTQAQIKSIAAIIPDNVKLILLDEIEPTPYPSQREGGLNSPTDGMGNQNPLPWGGAWGGCIDTDPSCIINTSGSTGTPKGVVLNHKSFFDFIDWSLETFGFGEDLVMGSLSPIVFDIYSFELCMLMAKASTLVVLPAHLAAFPAKILEVLEKHQVNFLFWVPTIMVNIANMDLLSAFKLESLRTVWFAGEVFPTKQFNYWHHHLPQVTFANLYGPIEITLDCTYYIINKEIPETAAAFVQNPLNKAYPELIYRTGDIVCLNDEGLIMFKGRKDNIVKHMGYRTDLGEIEHVIINTLKLVKNGCIVYNQAEKQITLFYEAAEEIPVPQFRMEIGKVLPKYMIPTVYHRLEQLQRNTNGKIDRLYYKKEVNK